MSKSESKYFNTAAKMDEAFLEILEKKDFAYITVKEICHAAGVNRSTFYLHYETLGDLLSESVEHMTSQFLQYMQKDAGTFIAKLPECPIDELRLVVPEYLMPYLSYVKEHRRVFRTALENSGTLALQSSFAGLFEHVLEPILIRFGVPENDREYMILFYISGLMAIVKHWLKNDCSDSLEHVAAVMLQCVPR